MRIRFRFSKLGKVRFTSQRDVARMWERALRRAGLPLAYTEGFSPRPQLSFGLALPTGAESLAEYLDVALDAVRAAEAGVDVATLPATLGALLPEGIEVEEAVVVERSKDSLQQIVTSCSWTMRLAAVTREELAAQVGALLAADTVPIVRERKGRHELDDLRPSVLALSLAGETEDAVSDPTGRTVGLVAELSTQPRGVRPVELVRGLVAVSVGRGEPSPGGTAPDGLPGSTPVLDRACRTQQWIERDGLRQEPLLGRVVPAGADRAMHAVERAS
ncbi:MAG: TIGR03936 family radical SAM-associated protein [Acidimicrobiales bacterium]